MNTLLPEVDEIWQAERARARGARKCALLDAIDGLRAAGLVVAAGVRPSKVSGELSNEWVAAGHVAADEEAMINAIAMGRWAPQSDTDANEV